ncbi:MAG: ATP-binding protein, partial [Promethearchaeota archaeon]
KVYQTYKFPIKQKNKKNLLGGFAIDITEQKVRENENLQLLQDIQIANKELSEFAYIVSHDLRTPIRGINNLAEWILADYSDKLDTEGRETLNLLMSRIKRMDRLINDILEYSRIGRSREEKIEINLDELLFDVLDFIVPPTNIKVQIAPNMPVIIGESTRIFQIFQNLLSNAVKFMDKPNGLIQIGWKDMGDKWQFKVTDNGPGIEKKYFKKIFQIFQTLALKDEYESTGIGLSLVKKIVELYGGKVWVESQVGKGSTFFFSLPKQL